MSYCRFSSLNWACDVYAYADLFGGYTIHLAGNRLIGGVPTVPPLSALASGSVSPEAWLAAHRVAADFIETAPREPITLPHAGESFREGDLEAFEWRLRMLRELGYRFPESVLEAIAEERDEDARAEEGLAGEVRAEPRNTARLTAGESP